MIDDRSSWKVDPRTINKGVNLALGGTVDYLTCSTSDTHVYDAWFGMLERNTKGWSETARVATEARWLQYKGYKYGPHIFLGISKHQGAVLRCSGAWANIIWPLVTPSARRISRADLAVTVKLENADPLVATRHYENNDDNGKRIFSTVNNSQGGSTTYVGSMSSEQSGRIYDKGAQLKREKGIYWRYEVMLRNLKSLALLTSLYNTWKDNGPVAGQIVGYVHEWFKVRGCSPIFERDRVEHQLVAADLNIDVGKTRLEWLRTSVAPAIEKLRVDGFEEEMKDILGVVFTSRLSEKMLRGDDLTQSTMYDSIHTPGATDVPKENL